MKTYLFFEEIEGELAKLAPTVVYKYRTWSSDLHKSLLLDHQIWFSHPFDLNDPLDVRPEHKFDLTEVNDIRYFEKLLKSANEVFSNLSPEQRKAKAEEQWEQTKKDPSHIITSHQEIQKSREGHNPYGVFSTSKNELSPHLWKEYGDNDSGYAVGFKTIPLCREMQCGFGLVIYSDEPYLYTFLSDRNSEALLYQKKTKWKDEEEFRFITATIGILRDRLQPFSVDVVAEVVLGKNMSPENETEIRTNIEKLYPPELPVYKVFIDDNGNLQKGKL